MCCTDPASCLLRKPAVATTQACTLSRLTNLSSILMPARRSCGAGGGTSGRRCSRTCARCTPGGGAVVLLGHMPGRACQPGAMLCHLAYRGFGSSPPQSTPDICEHSLHVPSGLQVSAAAGRQRGDARAALHSVHAHRCTAAHMLHTPMCCTMPAAPGMLPAAPVPRLPAVPVMQLNVSTRPFHSMNACRRRECGCALRAVPLMVHARLSLCVLNPMQTA